MNEVTVIFQFNEQLISIWQSLIKLDFNSISFANVAITNRDIYFCIFVETIKCSKAPNKLVKQVGVAGVV